jgi:hypothetical protein
LGFDAVAAGVTGVIDPEDIPLYEDEGDRDAAYDAAQADGTPFFAIERYEQGYAVTYDLLPAGRELAPPARAEVDTVTEREVKRIVGEASLPTSEVGRSIGPSLGHLSFFQQEGTARRVGGAIAEIVLDDANWVEASPPDSQGPRRS